jgi:hypothetical protein
MGNVAIRQPDDEDDEDEMEDEDEDEGAPRTRGTVKQRKEWSGGASGLNFGANAQKRRSVSFDDTGVREAALAKMMVRGDTKKAEKKGETQERQAEEKRRERRRSEAKAAIEVNFFLFIYLLL